MPKTSSTLSPSRLRLRALHLLMREPGRHNIGTLAEALGERYDRVRDAVLDIEAEFGLTTSGQRQLLTVLLPGEAVVA